MSADMAGLTLGILTVYLLAAALVAVVVIMTTDAIDAHRRRERARAAARHPANRAREVHREVTNWPEWTATNTAEPFKNYN